MHALQTDFGQIFKLSVDGRTFISPELMKGVPVERINDSDQYYEKSWDSLEFWQGLINSSLTKGDTPETCQMSPEEGQSMNGDYDDQNNSPKKAKLSNAEITTLMKWFGEGTPIHPNQIVAKRFIPSDGLCNSWCALNASRAIAHLQPL